MLPERIAESVEQWFEKDYRATFYERIDYLVESEDLYKDLPYAVRYGKTLNYILERISVFIQPGETIVGSVKEIIPTDEQKERVGTFIGVGFCGLEVFEDTCKTLFDKGPRRVSPGLGAGSVRVQHADSVGQLLRRPVGTKQPRFHARPTLRPRGARGPGRQRCERPDSVGPRVRRGVGLRSGDRADPGGGPAGSS